MKKSALILTAVLATGTCQAATVLYTGGDIIYSENTICGDIQINFKRCMANELYTFSSVRLNGKELNHTESDNIGPFLISNRGWAGGNHLNGDRRSAYTESVSVELDGKPLTTDTIAEGSVLTVTVVNQLLDPVDDSPFAVERAVYNVSGNSIDVKMTHDFVNEQPVVIDRYYGMQSMFVDDKEVLTPGGKYASWTSYTPKSTGHELQFTKAEAPAFTTIVEHSDNGYQAAHMFREGLGNRDFVADDDIVYIGNSWSKHYHKLMGMHPVKKGDHTMWHGIYSWFDAPIVDGCRNDRGKLEFEYLAYINGHPTFFYIHSDGHLTTMPFGPLPVGL